MLRNIQWLDSDDVEVQIQEFDQPDPFRPISPPREDKKVDMWAPRFYPCSSSSSSEESSSGSDGTEEHSEFSDDDSDEEEIEDDEEADLGRQIPRSGSEWEVISL
jgi:hypothetical protein